MKRAVFLLGLAWLLLGSSASAAPSLKLQPPQILRSVVMPSIGGSANPMNLSAWATLLGAALGVGGGIAILTESPSAPALLAVGGTLFLTGPSLSHFVHGEFSRGFVQLGLRVAAAAVLAGGTFWGIAAARSPVPWVVAGLGGLGLAGLRLPW